MSLGFQKKVEDFTCENCGKEVVGDGYTNHCPHCLWSKHLDINPGDRSADCDGMMRPIDIYLEGREWIITHECDVCRHKKRNKVSDNDDSEAIIKLQQEVSDKKMKG